MSDINMETIRTRIWQEEPEPDNAFAAMSCHCHGYDVYSELLGNASWIEYLYLLFRGEAPSVQQARLLEGLAIALANPGPRDAAVHAAMCGGVGGSTSASCLMAEAMGIPGHVIETAEDFDKLDLDAILRHPGPTVLDIRVDKKETPPMEVRLKVLTGML